MTQQNTDTERSTILSWREPGPLFAFKGELTGLQYLQGLAAGGIVPPPVAQVLGITVESADCSWGMTSAAFQQSPTAVLMGVEIQAARHK
ncbi:hypothetical protein [Streptomyces sporangiiformans]|uniref:Uncharacterized protein n=1 Tax=Streptomyces sporangiiformans TaxID=2315329 RepID=A0A505DH38_9ACTN|nr:hypothetical protein [Streptomyces sporangiiformans]TPQ22220.1 hypothetical protein FGD71_010880 [Streptomyces sporangiiformans]